MGLDDLEVYAAIKRSVDAAGSAAKWARQVGVSPQYVSQVLNAQKPPSDDLLAAVGLRRIVVRSNA